MKSSTRYITAIAFLGAAVVAAGCDTRTDARPVSRSQLAENTQHELQRARKEDKEAAQATKDYAYAVRAEYVKDMQNELAQVNQSLRQLSAKVERANAATKADAKVKLQVLADRVVQLSRELDQAKNAQETGWDQVKASFKKSNDELKASVEQEARTWLSEKIAP